MENDLNFVKKEEIFNEDDYSDKSILLKHGERIRLFECKLCDKSYARRRSLQIHLKSHLTDEQININSNRIFKCEYCVRLFLCKVSLTEHEQVHKKERLHRCRYCDKSYIHKSGLNKHLRLQHKERHGDENSNVCFRCEHCDKLFFSRASLAAHKHVHQDVERSHKCKHCYRSYTYRKGLNKHLRLQHKDRKGGYSSNLNIKCEQDFDSVIFSQAYPESHEQVHKIERPHKSEYCDKSYIYKNGLTLEITSPRKPEEKHLNFDLKSEHCDESFLTQTSHSTIDQVLDLEKQHNGQYCDDSYAHTADLDAHSLSKDIAFEQIGEGNVTGDYVIKAHFIDCDADYDDVDDKIGIYMLQNRFGFLM